jgi:hypothetical protein
MEVTASELLIGLHSPESSYTERKQSGVERDYRIEDRTPFYVNTVNNCRCLDSFPLDKVKIGFDTGKNRLLLEVDLYTPPVD